MNIGSFGVVRSHVVPTFRAAMSELCAIMSKVSDTSIAAYAAPSYRELAQQVERGDVALAWAPPVLAFELEERGLAQALAVPIRSGMASYKTALVVRERVPARVEELRGARVAWVDKESSSGYIVPRIHLASLGLDVQTFFSKETFHQSHTAVVDAVASGRVDVGATFYTVDAKGSIVSAAWTGSDGGTVLSVKIAASAGPIPNDMIVIAKSVPVTVRSSIQRWLLDLDARSRALFGEIIHGTEFRVPSTAHFQPLRAMIAAARARGVVQL